MKTLISLLLLSSFAFANYSLYYGNLKLGNIENFNTLKEHYLKIKITNSLARFLMSSKYLLLYNPTLYKEPLDQKKTKYKKDKYQVIYIIQKAIENKLKEERIVIQENKYIEIHFDKTYHFKYISKERLKSKGTISVINGEFIELNDEKNSVRIVKN